MIKITSCERFFTRLQLGSFSLNSILFRANLAGLFREFGSTYVLDICNLEQLIVQLIPLQWNPEHVHLKHEAG